MDLRDNFDVTVDTIRDIRRMLASARRSRSSGYERRTGVKPEYVDFTRLREISPAAVVMLAAELHRWNVSHPGRRLKAIETEKWDPAVCGVLKQVGFFELMRVPDPPQTPVAAGPVKYIKLIAGTDVNGKQVKEMQDQVVALVGTVPDSMPLYGSVIEAIKNVVDHAYAGRVKNRFWWLSASYDEPARKLTVMVLDHGRGIPVTLPRFTAQEKLDANLVAFLNKLGVKARNDDSAMIDAAVNLHRTSTGEQHRGYGLPEIRELIKGRKVYGRLRIISNRGVYVYERLTTIFTRKIRDNKARSINGTFVEWILELPAATE